MIIVGTQYYRPPFPDRRYWDEDLRKMADSGLNAVQLWVKWAWVEPAPGEFRFDDYDALVAAADRHGLKVVLSTIAAIHPYWIHREVPDSEMVDNMGRRVVSSNRIECHQGLTPGGCFDHPGVWDRMARFLSEVTRRYRGAANLFGWDAWNELRWNVQADGLVCYCPHTLQRFRAWLAERHGDLDGLNRAWRRRYRRWDEVMPGKMPRGPYTEMMAFEHFITARSNAHAKARYDTVKSLDPAHPVTVHGGQPSVLHGDGYPGGTALHRGNDWAFAEHIDGIGTSSFPHWGGIDDADFGVRIDCTASAAGERPIWLSELQGGRASHGFQTHTPVPAAAQQRWLWAGLSRRAEAILFWCWRDEVFGCESAGFGLDGRDGFAEERLAAMRRTAGILRREEAILAGFRPDAPRAGVFFSPQSYYLHWAEESHGRTAQTAVQGYARALVRAGIPYRLVEEEHLDALRGLRLLFLPRTVVIDDAAAAALSDFTRAGGMLVCESECGAFASNGLYRYPEERFVAALTGVAERGRRTLSAKSFTARLDGVELHLPARQWLTPFASDGNECWATSADGPLLCCAAAGAGRVVLCGTYMGDAYFDGSSRRQADAAPYAAAFEQLVVRLAARAGVVPCAQPESPTDAPALVRMGRSGSRRVAFVIGNGSAMRLRFPADTWPGPVRDIVGGGEVCLSVDGDGQTCAIPASEWGVAVLVG